MMDPETEGGQEAIDAVKSLRTQLETRIQTQHSTHLDLLASLPHLVPTLDLSLRLIAAFNHRPFSPTPPLPPPKKISNHPLPQLPPQPKLAIAITGHHDPSTDKTDQSGNPLSVVRAMVADFLLQKVPFEATDSSTVLRKLENGDHVTAAERLALRDLGGESGTIYAVETALRTVAEETGGVELEEFVVGGKSRLMVMSIDRMRLVRELPEDAQRRHKRARESESVNTVSGGEWGSVQVMGDMWMYPGRGRGMGMPPATSRGVVGRQRQRTEEDDLKDLEALLNKKSFREMQKSKTGEEILSIINRPTARETAVAAKVFS